MSSVGEELTRGQGDQREGPQDSGLSDGGGPGSGEGVPETCGLGGDTGRGALEIQLRDSASAGGGATALKPWLPHCGPQRLLLTHCNQHTLNPG